MADPTLPDGWGDPTVVPKLIVDHILTTSNAYAQAKGLPAITIDPAYLTGQLVEITPQTQTAGAALLQVTFADPAWQITRSGICNQNADGLLYQVDVNYPEGTPVWWRLVDVQFGSADASQGQANLTMIFQHRIVSYLADCWGPLHWPKGKIGQTRAQFVKMLVDKMPSEIPRESIGPGPAPDDVVFICPQINEIQPVQGTITTRVNGKLRSTAAASGTQVITTQTQASRGRKINKQPGVTSGTKVTVKGSAPSTQQLHCINLVLDVGRSLNAPTLALEAAVFDLIFESDCGVNNGWDATNPTYGGCLAGNKSYFGGYGTASSDPVSTAEATAFFNGGKGYQAGGAIAASRTYTDPATLGPAVTAPFDKNDPPPYGQYLKQGGMALINQVKAEAIAIVQAYNGGTLASKSFTSDIAQLARGSDQNPDEDSWACMQRLASEVNWAVFTSPSPAPGVFGNYIYYIDYPTLVAQKPALYLELSDDGTTWSATDPDTGKTVAAQGVVNTLTGEIDNTSMQRQVTRTVKGRLQRQRVLSAPQTPATVMFNMLCGWLEYNAGDVFVFHNSGPANGRWIVEDVTCNTLGDLYSQFTLGPPTYPYPEPQATANGGKTPVNPAGTGTAQGAADVAKAALARQQSLHCFHYPQGDVRPAGGIQYELLTANPVVDDCSGFAIACYKLASLPDPSGNNYDHSGYTGDMITHCTQVSLGTAQPGDLVFYGPSVSQTTHVTVYIGNGQVISMGREGDPSQGAWTAMGPTAPLGIFRSNLLTGANLAAIAGTGSSAPSAGGGSAPSQSGVGVRRTVSGGGSTTLTGGFKGLFG